MRKSFKTSSGPDWMPVGAQTDAALLVKMRGQSRMRRFCGRPPVICSSQGVNSWRALVHQDLVESPADRRWCLELLSAPAECSVLPSSESSSWLILTPTCWILAAVSGSGLVWLLQTCWQPGWTELTSAASDSWILSSCPTEDLLLLLLLAFSGLWSISVRLSFLLVKSES